MVRDPRSVSVHPVVHARGCRTYAVIDPASREACVVDPLHEGLDQTLALLAREKATLRWIVDTQTHGDHVSGAAALQARAGGEVVMHPAAAGRVATVRARDGEGLGLGEQVLVVRHAPGNSPDALMLFAPGAVFTGDTLLIGTVGLRDAPGADARAHFRTLRGLLDPLPGTTVLHPGHDDMGRSTTTLAAERRGNPWLRQDDLEAFVAAWEADPRPVPPEAPAYLEANREGLARPPKQLAHAVGFPDPARRTERILQAAARLEPDGASPGPVVAEGLQDLCAALGLAVLLGTAAGWLLAPVFHGVSLLAGLALLALGLVGARRRRKARARGPGLWYEGPTRHRLTS